MSWKATRLAAAGALLLVACMGGGGGAPAQPSSTHAGQCERTAGPLVGHTFESSVPPPPRGGVVADGVYDLVRLVAYRPEPTRESQRPMFRWTLRFSTTERSANHTAGDVTSAMEIAPEVRCTTGRFVSSSGGLRADKPNIFMGGQADFIPYDAAGDMLVFLVKGGGTPTTTYWDAYFFQRRS